MTINFTKNVEQYTTTQRSNKVKHFTDFTSKKQLEEAGVLSQDKLNFVKEIKGTFSFSFHEDGRYMAITLYKATAEKKYNFLIVDLKELAIAEVGSIKEAKAAILELAANKEEEEGESGDEEPEPSLSAEVADGNLESIDIEETYIPGISMEA